MTTRKHLVLDEDVHVALSQRREMTGIPMNQIGNKILRSHISASLFQQFLGELLVESGCVTEDKYQDILDRVDRRMYEEHAPHRPPLTRLANGNFVSGSWEIRTVHDDPMGSFQLLEAWARDSFQNAMTQHSHQADEYLIALGGRTFVVLAGIPFTLACPGALHIPAGAIHSVTPLDKECRMAILVAPSVREYSAS
ncbi:hypothetical protein KKG90_06475 [Candidatus Bipolaricaulota bacterium]|nr:hypothetical protein [Candidatus Bipolaricaulota bacterium]